MKFREYNIQKRYNKHLFDIVTVKATYDMTKFKINNDNYNDNDIYIAQFNHGKETNDYYGYIYRSNPIFDSFNNMQQNIRLEFVESNNQKQYTMKDLSEYELKRYVLKNGINIMDIKFVAHRFEPNTEIYIATRDNNLAIITDDLGSLLHYVNPYKYYYIGSGIFLTLGGLGLWLSNF